MRTRIAYVIAAAAAAILLAACASQLRPSAAPAQAGADREMLRYLASAGPSA